MGGGDEADDYDDGHDDDDNDNDNDNDDDDNDNDNDDDDNDNDAPHTVAYSKEFPPAVMMI